MRKPYELRTIEHADLIGAYPDRQSALAVIRDVIERYGDEHLQSVALARTSLRGDIWPIAVGQDLVALALSEPSGPPTGRRAHPRRVGTTVTAVRGRVARRTMAAV